MDRGLAGYSLWGSHRVRNNLAAKQQHHHCFYLIGRCFLLTQ